MNNQTIINLMKTYVKTQFLWENCIKNVSEANIQLPLSKLVTFKSKTCFIVHMDTRLKRVNLFCEAK